MVNGMHKAGYTRARNRSNVESIFPHFVTRVSGLPTGYVEALRATASDELVDRLHEVEATLHQNRDALSEALHEAVAAANEKKQRTRLIKLRRDCYNLRPIDVAELNDLLPRLPNSAAQALKEYAQRQEVLCALRIQFERQYKEDTGASRRRFKELLADEDFLKGLLLSSRTLFKQRRRYLEADEDNLKRKEERIECGLLRYFTRAAMKATPFGAFCAVLPGRFVAGEEDDEWTSCSGLQFNGHPGRKQSYVRLNKGLFGALVAHLKERPAVRRALPVALNPTLRAENDALSFLAEVEGREVFQRADRNSALDLIVNLCRKEATPLGEMIGALVGHADLDASESEAEQYLHRLIETGLLRCQTGIPEQEIHWIRPLCDLLEPVLDERAKEIRIMLTDVQEAVQEFEAAESVEKRAVHLAGIEALIRESFEAWEINFPRLVELPIYEDATAASYATRPHDTCIDRTLKDLEEYVRLTSRLAWPRDEQATMRYFFDTYYGSQDGYVPLLQFYEDYYREHFKVHLEKQQNARKRAKQEHQKVKAKEVEDQSIETQNVGEEEYNLGNPFHLEYISRLHEARKNVRALIVERWLTAPDAGQITIQLDELAEALEDVPDGEDTCNSVSAFIQFVHGRTGAGEIILPGGKYHTGFGKFFSRFLYLFPEEVEEAVCNANEGLTTKDLAEICGDANFNANFHPPLLPFEISYPTGELGDAGAHMSSLDLEIGPAYGNVNRLRLRHRQTGTEVIPVDLGFLNPRMRPPLYQLLARCSPPSNLSLPLPDIPRLPNTDEAGADERTVNEDANTDSEKEESPRITYRPQIVLNGSLILARKQWLVPDGLFPTRSPGETGSDYFLRVGQWRRKHDLPREVYARIRPHYERPPETSPSEEGPKRTPPDANPKETSPLPLGEGQGEGKSSEQAKPETAAQKANRRNRTRMSRDYRKPQYIDFSSPLLVNLFGRMTTNLKQFSVMLEERYPEASALPKVGDDTFATETILQLNFTDDHAGHESAKIQEAAYANA